MGAAEKYIKNSKEIKSIINRCSVCRLGMSNKEIPYVVPLCFGFDGEGIYFHTGLSGRKVSFLEANPNVCCEFDNNIKTITDFILSSWSMAYVSAIVNGYAYELIEDSDKFYGLFQITRHYSSEELEIPYINMKAVKACRVDIKSMRGILSVWVYL